MLTSAICAAIAVALMTASPPRSRLRRLDATRSGPPAGIRATVGRSDLWTSPWFAAALAAFTTTRFVSGWPGIAAAAVVGLLVHRWVGGLESAGHKARRDQINRDLPFAVDLVVAALAAGRPPGQVLRLVGEAVGGPLDQELQSISARLDLGADPVEVWKDMTEHPDLAVLGRSFARAHQSGASMTTVLDHCAQDLRRQRRAALQQRARSVGVRTAAPLGACFLPAFILVGIVPTIVGAFQRFVL